MSNKPQNPEAPDTSPGDNAQAAPRKERPKASVYGWEKIEGEGGKAEYRARISFTPTKRPNTLAGMIRDLTSHERESLLVIQKPRAKKDKETGKEIVDPTTGEVVTVTDLLVSENRAAPGQPPEWHPIATGHAVNSRSDGKPVTHRDLLFAPSDATLGTAPIRASVTAAITPELYKALGFTESFERMQEIWTAEKQARAAAKQQSQGAPKTEQPARAVAPQTTQASRGKEDPLDVKPDETPAKSARNSRPKARAAQREVAENVGPSM